MALHLTMTGTTPYSEKQLGDPIGDVIPSVSATNWIFVSIWSYRVIRILLGGIFLWSGLSKLIDLAPFVIIIDAYGLIPEGWTMTVALGLSILEIIAGLGLLLDIRGMLAVIAALLVMFMAILGYGVWMGLDIDCGCFGPGDPEAKAYNGLRPALYRDIVMMAGVLYLYFWRCYRPLVQDRLSDLFKKRSEQKH